MVKQVRRIVLVLYSDEPLVIRPIGGLDALRSLVGLQADLVDGAAAQGLWAGRSWTEVVGTPSALASGLAQSMEHVVMVFRS